MAGDHHYRSLSSSEDVSDEARPLNEKAGYIKPSGWGRQSILLSIATGTLFIAVLAAVLSTVASAVVSYGSGSSGHAHTTALTTTAATPSPTAALSEDKSSKVTDPDDDIAQPAHIQTCGYTPEQARANGCVFDVMMQLWTPKDCFDEPLSERFLEVGNWTWYADSNADHIFTLEEMRKGEHDAVYVAQDYHITHCIYAWERLVRAMRNQQPLITELISYDHVIHCRHKTLQRADGGSTIRGVRAPTGYTECAKYDTWKYNLPSNEHSSTE